MDMLVVIVMLVMFFFLMLFIFSTALLTPLIGKRNLIFVLSLGFVVGLVGGAFFIAPLYDDIPDIARSVYTSTSGGSEIITVNMSTDNDVNSFIENTKKINGVKDVQGNSITVKTDPLEGDWKSTLETRLPIVESDIKSVHVISNDTFVMTLNNNSNPSQVVKNVRDWLQLVGGVDIISNIADVSITVDPSQVNSVSAKLPQDQVVIASITGPLEDKITSLKQNLPDRTSIVILCGFVGLFTGLVGVFIDSIDQLWGKTSIWLKERKRKL